MVEQPESAANTSLAGIDSATSPPPPPRVAFDPHRLPSPLSAGPRALAIAAIASSVSLAIAAANIWLRGASGDFYENRIGTTAWHLPMAIAVGTGLAIGWAASRRKEDRS